MKITAVITGDKAINKKLARLTGKDAKAVIRKSQRPALKPIHAAAKSNAQKNKRTGNFGRSIKVRSIKRTRSGIGTKVTSGVDAGFPGEFYGSFIEYDREGFVGHKALHDAVEAKKSQALRTYGDNILKNITALAKK